MNKTHGADLAIVLENVHTILNLSAGKTNHALNLYNMKSGFITALLLFCFLLNTAQTNTLVIQGDMVNIRKTADVKGEVVTKAKQSDVLAIIQKDKLDNVNGIQDYWYKVKVGTYEGYVFGHFTSLKMEAPKINSNIEIVEYSGLLFNNAGNEDEQFKDKGRGTFTADVLDYQGDIWCQTAYNNLLVKVGVRDESAVSNPAYKAKELTLKLTVVEQVFDFSLGKVIKQNIIYTKSKDIKLYDENPYYYPFLIDNVDAFYNWIISFEIVDKLTKKVLLKKEKLLPTACNPSELGE